MAKIQKKNDYTFYKPISMDFVDPTKELPTIKARSDLVPEIDPLNALRRSLDDANRRYAGISDEEGFTQSRKRKGRTPEKVEKNKRKKMNSPEKIGVRIANFLNGIDGQESECEEEALFKDNDDTFEKTNENDQDNTANEVTPENELTTNETVYLNGVIGNAQEIRLDVMHANLTERITDENNTENEENITEDKPT